MKRWAIVMSLAVMGCSQPQTFEEKEAERRSTIAYEARESVKAQLRDPESASFSSVFNDPADASGTTVCGLVNAKNGFGGYTGDQPFVVVHGQAFVGEEVTRLPPAFRGDDGALPCGLDAAID